MLSSNDGLLLRSLLAVTRWRPGGYLKSSGRLALWLFVRTVGQALLFLLLARTLRAEGYGAFIVVLATATFFTPFAALGTQAVILREGARDPDHLKQHLGDSLRSWLCASIPLALVAWVVAYMLVGPALTPFAMMAVVFGEVVCASAVELFARAWQARNSISKFGAISAGLVFARIVGLLLVLQGGKLTASEWGVAFCLASATYLILIAGLAARSFGNPVATGHAYRVHWKSGLPFAWAGSALRLQAEANKPLLARLDDVATAGLFSAAHRITDLVALPAAALVEGLYPRVYRTRGSNKGIYLLGAAPIVIALLGGSALVLIVDHISPLLGSSFAGIAEIIPAMAMLPTLVVIRSLFAVAVANKDGEAHFLWSYSLAAVASVLGTLVLVPRYGLPGAVGAAYASEILLILLLGVSIARR